MSLITQTAQGTALSVVSNVLAQVLKAYKSNTPLNLDLEPIYKFGMFGVVNNPPNILWQNLLEDLFPTNVPVAGRPSEKEVTQPQTRMSKRNIAIKFFLDQTIGAFLNTVLFLAFMGYMNATPGQDSWAVVEKEVRERFWPLLIDGMKLWPLVSLISFVFVPVEKRVVFGCLAGIGWNIYLSMLVG